MNRIPKDKSLMKTISWKTKGGDYKFIKVKIQDVLLSRWVSLQGTVCHQLFSFIICFLKLGDNSLSISWREDHSIWHIHQESKKESTGRCFFVLLVKALVMPLDSISDDDTPFPSWRLHPNTRNQALGTLEATCEAAVRFSLWFASTRSTFQLGQASMSLWILC